MAPTTCGGKVVQFSTRDEREYAGGFCRSYAEIASSILWPEDHFVEVFSGPNAPLSAAICNSRGERLPGCKLDTSKGIKNELQRLSQLTLRPLVEASNMSSDDGKRPNLSGQRRR